MRTKPLKTLLITARECHAFLKAKGLAHVFIGGIAVGLYGAREQSRDVDLLVRDLDKPDIKDAFASAGYKWLRRRRAYKSPKGVRVDFRSPEDGGDNDAVRLPDPLDPNAYQMIEGLPILSLARLIESKIQGCHRKQKKDRHLKHCIDVRELIIANSLGEDFGSKLNEGVREQFREFIMSARPPSSEDT